MLWLWPRFLFVAAVVTTCGGETWQDTSDTYSAVYTYYNNNNGNSITDIIPATNQTAGITVYLAMALDSLNGFDAVKGQIDISGSMMIDWVDQTIPSIASDIKVAAILVDFDKVWSPSLVLLNAVDTVKKVGDTTYKVLYTFATYQVTWQPRVLLRASCTPDVTFYPFDRQTCEFTYTPWGYSKEEIQLAVRSSEWDTTKLGTNGIWQIVSTSSSTYEQGGSFYCKFTLVIQRQPLYFTFNIALPILLLGLLNGFVFLLPAESGERVGFCVTCFLSFVVLLQTTMNFLPQLASPMSLLCYYVFIMMCFSVVINIITICMLRIYHRTGDDPVPPRIQKFVRVVSCIACRCDPSKRNPEIDWPTFARQLDFFFFVLFVAGQTAFTIIFILPIASQY